MEHRAHFIKSEERRCILRRLSEIAHIDYHRPVVIPMPVHILRKEVVHPCPTALGGPREIIRHQITDQRPV